jgi:arginyl-tRNA--protein-N-Asp/Glu arginylyltransferase
MYCICAMFDYCRGSSKQQRTKSHYCRGSSKQKRTNIAILGGLRRGQLAMYQKVFDCCRSCYTIAIVITVYRVNLLKQNITTPNKNSNAQCTHPSSAKKTLNSIDPAKIKHAVRAFIHQPALTL